MNESEVSNVKPLKMKMLIRKRSFLMVIIFGMFATVYASPCGTAGMTVVKAFDGQNFVIYSYRPGSDVAFQIPGKDISFPNGTSGPKRFVIDGVFFETLFVPITDFLKTKDKLSDVDVLRKHKEFEVEYLTKSAGPLSKFVELGPRERPAGNQQPAFTFYLWQMANPRDERGTRQFYLTTLSENDVVVLSAVVGDDVKERMAMTAFQSFAGTFQHILKKEQCPEKK